MVNLQNGLSEIEAQGLGLAVITYDSRAVMADFTARRGITFPLLSDPGSSTIKTYGILNTTVEDLTSRNYGIPFPGTFVVDRQGIVTARFFEEAFQQRTTVSTMMLTLGTSSAPVAARRITTDHLQVTTYATDEVVAPGSLFSIVFDVTPRERMHVYAPGAEGYRVIGLSLDPNPLLVTRPVQYPASEIYYFEPLDERVPVYQGPFTWLQEVIVEGTREAARALRELDALTLGGTFEFQACDDEVCFVPVSVPISFTLDLDALDVTQRCSGLSRGDPRYPLPGEPCPSP